MITIIGIIIALGILILVHESGHFLAAKMTGVKVEKFSIGFGSPIFSITRGETEYCISAIPLGGFVKMKGEISSENNEFDGDEFMAKTWLQRVFIAFNGPFFNLILAFILFIFSFFVGRTYEDQLPLVGKINNIGITQIQKGDEILAVDEVEISSWSEIYKISSKSKNNEIKLKLSRNKEILTVNIPNNDPTIWYKDIYAFAPAIVGDVISGLPAYQAGLKKGDRILAINGVEINDWYEMRDLIVNNPKNVISIKIERDGNEFSKNIKLDENLMSNNEKILGINQKLPIKLTEHYNLIESVKYGTMTTINAVSIYYISLYKLLLKPSSLKTSVASPVMIVSMSKQTAEKGLSAILMLIASISIMLMIMNLLPIPVLDGGQIFFFTIEGIFKKPIPFKIQGIMQQIGIILLLGLSIFAIFNDVNKVVNRTKSISEQNQISAPIKQSIENPQEKSDE